MFVAITDYISWMQNGIRQFTAVALIFAATEDRNMARDQRDVADALFDRKLSLTARVVPGGDHSEASWERQAPFFIATLMYGLDA